MSPRLYKPMLRAAINEQDPSSNRNFVDPCVRAMGTSVVVEDLLDFVREGADADAAGAVRALYWAWRPRHRQAPWAQESLIALLAVQRRTLLMAFVARADVRVRQCIVPQLDVDAAHYPEDLRPLVSEAVAIARGQDDPYVRHRIEVQLGNARTFLPLPRR